MFGFLIGTACLIGLVKVLRWGRGGRGWHGHSFAGHGGACGGGGGWGGGCGPGFQGECGPGGFGGHEGPGGYGGPGYGGGPGFGFRGRGFGFRGGVAERLSSWLGASEEQHRTIEEALEGFWKEVKDLRGEAHESRKDVAKAVRSPSFDAEQMGETFARQDRHIETIRKAFVGAVARVHVVLTEEQRERLARIVERGPFGGGPYRAPAWL